jgi:L-lactate utilization protein LutB
MSLSSREIERAAISRLALLVEEFSETIVARIVSRPTAALDAIEGDWQKLREQTEQVYQKMVSELVDAVDERSMIAKKKQNGGSVGYH